jgi:hypothetical protein
VAHAKSYVKAIDFSIVAAQKGFNIAEEAINFSKLGNDHTTEAERTKLPQRNVGYGT